jgi:hypothetical protein
MGGKVIRRSFLSAIRAMPGAAGAVFCPAGNTKDTREALFRNAAENFMVQAVPIETVS